MLVIYLKRNQEEISYGELWKSIKSKSRKQWTAIQRANKVVEELNELLPTICLTQKTMYYFVKEE